jgi:hypothetical protein
MALIDYTSAANVKAYGDIINPTAEQDALLTSLVSAMSRQLDTYTNQTLSTNAYTGVVLRAQVDRDGLLLCWPTSPTLTTLTSAEYRLGASQTWTTLSTSAIDLDELRSGCILRFLGVNLVALRGQRLQVRLTYTGGWANLAAVPADFEYLARRLVWWAYKKATAPIDKTADPLTGQIIIPSAWPRDIKDALTPYKRLQP